MRAWAQRAVASGYTYFTTDFGTTNGFGAGVAKGTVAVYPYPNQQQLPTSFDHGTEEPDPLPEVQYSGRECRLSDQCPRQHHVDRRRLDLHREPERNRLAGASSDSGDRPEQRLLNRRHHSICAADAGHYL